MRIFLSSTYLDLIEHRQAVRNALERLGQQIGCMEVFGARPSEPLKACLEEITTCDLFIGIYAHRYGHVPNQSRHSITEEEFHWAHSQRKPIFCFVVNDKYPWSPHLTEPEPNGARLLTFKAFIKERVVVDFFNEPLDLAVKVATAIGHYLIHNQKMLVVPFGDGQAKREREALLTLLETRKNLIVEKLSGEKNTLERFLDLHNKNIEAISKGELLLSHLLTSEIHSLIYNAVMNLHSKFHQNLHAMYAEYPGAREAANLARAYPVWSQFKSDQQYKVKPMLSYENIYKDTTSRMTRNLVHHSEWRERLIHDWLNSKIKPIQNELSSQRRQTILEQEADARGIQPAIMQPDHKIICPYCRALFLKQINTERKDRCPKCLTYVEVVDQPTPVEYCGHRLLGLVCIKCGCSKDGIKHFGFKCN